MSNPKMKLENYSNFGGINSKTSAYDTGPMEFLDLINVDFQTPGALTQRWGSTMYVGQTFPAPITTEYEFIKIDGSSYVMIGHTGGLWYGATTGNSQGLSGTAFSSGASFLLNGFFNSRAQSGLGGPVLTQSFPTYFLGFSLLVPIWSDGINGASSFYNYTGMTQGENRFDFVTFQNKLYAGDGKKFFKFDGITISGIALPPPIAAPGSGAVAGSDATTFPGLGISTGWYAVYASYIDSNNNEGPVWPVATINTNAVNGSTLAAAGGSFMLATYNIKVPDFYDVQGVNVYSYARSSATLYIGDATDLLALPYVFRNQFRKADASATTIPISFGTTLGGISIGAITSNQEAVNISTETYFLPGITYSIASPGGATIIDKVNIAGYAPRYLELYKNRLFLAGFSTTPSQVWFSETGDGNSYQADSNFEVRTNDGDVVTAMRAYSTRLYIFKKNSFYGLNGDTPANFFLQELSLEYGCLNNRCAIVYDDLLLFLDRQGLIMYDGAGIKNLSSIKIQPVFDSMNYSAALTEACMVHDKLRNEVLLAIPTNGATLNNVVVVYDYIAGAFTKYDNLSIASMNAIQGRNNSKNAFYGSYSGSLNWFGASFLADNGVGYTTYIKPRFMKPMGESVEEQFRRLYINADPGNSLGVKINFFQDYGPSIVYSTTMVLNQFQTRIDFGIPAKAISFEMSAIQTNIPLRVYGFSIESRYQRGV